MVVYSRNDENARETARTVKSLGRKALISKTDVSDAKAVGALFQRVARELGRMDILVNNAGVWLVGPLVDLPEESWDRVLDVDLKGTYLCTQAFARHLKTAGKKGRVGKVVNIGSVHGTRPWRGASNYAAAKAGLVNLTRAMALELAEYSITVNVVSPGAIAAGGNAAKSKDPAALKQVETEVPLKRMGRPEEVAKVVAFLVGREGDYITGAEIVIDGGLLLYPYTV